MKTAQKIALGLSAFASLASLAGAASAQASTSATATGTITVLAPLTLNKTANLAFGSVIRPTSGVSTITVDNGGTRTVTGTSTPVSGTATAAAFQLIGEGGAAYSVAVPASFNMISGTNTLAVSTTNNAAGGGVLTGLAGTIATATFAVGGSVNISTATIAGGYSGNLIVTASYN